MSDDYVERISLCCVLKKMDSNANPWLMRIADVENGTLVAPQKSRKASRPTMYFENRDQIYWFDGPRHSGDVGIWRWTASPNRDRPSSDYVESWYLPDYCPIHVVVVPNARTIEFVIEQLINGIQAPLYNCDVLFCYERYWGKFGGVLCKMDDLVADGEMIKLRSDVRSLPQYFCTSENIYEATYSWLGRKYRFLKMLHIGEPEDFISVGNIDDIIRSAIISRVTWNVYKDTMNGTKAEWRNCKALLDRLGRKSLYEMIAEELKCSPEEAKIAVDEFIEHANLMIDQGDIESEVLAQIILHHDGLREHCESVATEQWEHNHRDKVTAAQTELLRIQQEAAETEQTKKSLQEQIDIAKSKLTQLNEDITKCETSYEALGDRAAQYVRDKITDAQEDLAKFIAELSVFMPQPIRATSGVVAANWKYISGTAQEIGTPEICENWKDMLDLFQGNLQSVFSVNSELSKLLSAFLYAAYIHRMPLMIAGPYAREFADALSMSVSGKPAGLLDIGTGLDVARISELSDCNDSVIVVQNMFQDGWKDTFLQPLASCGKFIVWIRPYVEDLLIEPKGLYNYALPVFTECFIESAPLGKFVPGVQAAEFQVYSSTPQRPTLAKLLKQLRLSKLTINRMQSVLSDAAGMIDLNNRDIDIFFSMLPLSVVTGQVNLLKDALEAETGISDAVKTEIKRYISDD